MWSLRYYPGGVPCTFEWSLASPETVICRLDLADPAVHPRAQGGLQLYVLLKGGVAGLRGEDGRFLTANVQWSFCTTPVLQPKIIFDQVAEVNEWMYNKRGVVRVDGGLSPLSELDWVEANVTLSTPKQGWSQPGFRFEREGACILTGNSANFPLWSHWMVEPGASRMRCRPWSSRSASCCRRALRRGASRPVRGRTCAT